MKISYDALVDTDLAAAWAALCDVDRVLAALPGAALTRDGDEATGSVKTRLGSTQVTYRVSAGLVSHDPPTHQLVVTVTGMEARGDGTVVATLTVGLRGEDTGTAVTVTGDITATGRGAAADAATWSRLLERYLAAAVPATDRPPAASSATDRRAPSPPAPPPPAPPTPIRPSDAAPARTAEQAAAVVGTAALLLILLWLLRRGGSDLTVE